MNPTPEALMEQYAADFMEKVYYFCLRKCGDPFAAEDRSVQDIADAPGIPRGTVLARLHRARKHMKEGMNMAREFGIRSYKPEEIEFINNRSSFGVFGVGELLKVFFGRHSFCL